MRISKYTGKELKDIVVFGDVDKGFIQELKDNDNDFYEIYVDDKVLQLKRKRKKCQYLTSKGCSILEARPLLCRLFPFSYDEDDKGKIFITLPKAERKEEEDCTICYDNYSKDMDTALNDMKADRKAMLKLIKQSLKELEVYEKYNKLISEGVSYEDIIKKFKIKV